ncbi:MAG: hypothetical protein JO040_01050 [Gemmatimonadetes bacterium]|nr:hypothetical protein [Gemmatimonadota bacterium]
MKGMWAVRGFLAGAVLAVPAGAQQEGPVELRVTEHPGKLVTVCLESAPRVEGSKRAVVSFGDEAVKLTTGRDNHGPHCASSEAGDARFHVRLEQTRYLIASTVVMDRDFTRAEYEGKTLTFFWTRD